MATEIEALMLRMEVSLRGYERELTKARKTTDEAMKRIEDRTRDTSRRVEQAMNGINFGGLAAAARGAVGALGPLGVALGAVLSAEGFRQGADGYIRTINALKVAGLSGRELQTVYQQLFDIAQKQGAPIEQLSRLYGSLAQAQGDLKVSSQQILTVVAATGEALRVSGVPTEQAAGAILGLSQALSGGTVRAEEFNQMLEGGLRPALQAAANGLQEAGGSVGKLRQLVTEGEVSSRAFFAAIEAGRPTLTALAATAGETSAQALERLKNEAINLAGELDKATGASSAAASALGGVANAAQAIAARVPAAAAAIGELVKQLRLVSSVAGAIDAAVPAAQRAAAERQSAAIEARLRSDGGVRGRAGSRAAGAVDRPQPGRTNPAAGAQSRARLRHADGGLGQRLLAAKRTEAADDRVVAGVCLGAGVAEALRLLPGPALSQGGRSSRGRHPAVAPLVPAPRLRGGLRGRGHPAPLRPGDHAHFVLELHRR